MSKFENKDLRGPAGCWTIAEILSFAAIDSSGFMVLKTCGFTDMQSAGP